MQPMRSFLLTLLVSLSAAGPALSQPRPAPRALQVTGVPAGDNLPIRAEPRAGAPVIGIAPAGARGIETEGEESGGWLRIRFRSVVGWADRRLLSTDGGGDGKPVRGEGWFVLLGSFSDPATTPKSLAEVRQRARRCGANPVAAKSDTLPGLSPGFTVSLLGPFPSRAVADEATRAVRPCVPGAFAKRSAFES